MQNYEIRERFLPSKDSELSVFPDILSHILFHKNIKTRKEAEAFISPSFEEGVFDPFLLDSMDKAVLRILEAISSGEKIAIYADYDADGIPGAVIMEDFFQKINYENYLIYIPHRHDEGFGLNADAINKLKKDGVSLIITIDCGITDIEEVDLAGGLKIDVIITDHHLPVSLEDGKFSLPKAFAIINPKISPLYPDKMLCGCAVIWKVICAILSKDRLGAPLGFEKWLLDLVGVSTLSDMVPLLGENRTLAFFGLVVLRKSKRPGIQMLLRKLRIKQSEIGEDDITFILTPRINAASRMGNNLLAKEILSMNPKKDVGELIKEIENLNKERKSITGFLSKEVKKVVEAKYSPSFSNKVIVAGNPSWQPAMLGLVAGSLVEKHSKPVFLWGREGSRKILKGSCRAPEGLSLTDIMSEVDSQVFTDFGGHKQAGGFSVSYDSIHLLEEELEKAYLKTSGSVSLSTKYIDLELFVKDLSLKILDSISKLSPFGIGNEKPLILVKNANIKSIDFFGKKKEHLKVILSDEDKEAEAISFFVDQKLLSKFSLNEKKDVLVHMEKNSFGKSPFRLRIVDVV